MANQVIISLAGVNVDVLARENLIYLMQGGVFWAEGEVPELLISVEDENKHDPSALLATVAGKKIGYVPKKWKGVVNAFAEATGRAFPLGFRVHEWGQLSNGEGIFCVIALEG